MIIPAAGVKTPFVATAGTILIELLNTRLLLSEPTNGTTSTRPGAAWRNPMAP